MPKNVFACKRCNASFLYADSLRRHSIVRHAKKISVDAAGRLKEYEISDHERERERIRHRPAKGPYPKRASHVTEESIPRHAHPKSSPPPHSIPSLLSLKLNTPECPMVKRATADHEACANASGNNTQPATHFSPLVGINTSFSSLSPHCETTGLSEVIPMEPLSPDPLLSCVLGDLSSGSGHSSPMQDSQRSSLCRAVHCVPTPAVPQTSNATAVDLTQSRSAAVVMASDNCSNADQSCVYQQVSPPSDPVQEQRSDGDPIVHASAAEIPVHFPSASIVAIVQGRPISGAETLQAIYGGMVPTELSLRGQSLRDADLVRRTARYVAGHLLSGIFDGQGDDARAVNAVARRWLLRLLE
jgi:hypothetical protein